MPKGKGTKVLETGVDAFTTHKPTLLERVNVSWRPVPPSVSSPKPRSPRIGLQSLVLKDKSKPKARTAAAGSTFSGPSRAHKCRGCTSKDPNGDVRHDRDTCRLPPSSSAATSLLELGHRPGGGSLNPLAGPSMQRARFVHERAKDLISASEVPSPAASSRGKDRPRTKGEMDKVKKDRTGTVCSWFSFCTKSKDGCDCDNQGQGNLGRQVGETLINMSSEESLVNITFADSPVLPRVLFRIADEHETTEYEHEHEQQKTFEDTETDNSREDNMTKRKIEVGKPESSATAAAAPVPAPIPVPAPSQPRDREPELSLAQRLKAMKDKHDAADKSGARAEEDIWGGERRVQGPGGILRGESEVESGFVEVDIPASNIKETKILPGIASSSRVRYLGLALQDAMETPLPKPTEGDITRALGGMEISNALSGGAEFNGTRSSPASTQGSATNNAARTGQASASPVPLSGRTRSAPLSQPASSASPSTGQPSKNNTSNDTAGPSRSLPIQIKKPGKACDLNESFFKVGPQDTGYPDLDSSATSSNFGFHPTIPTMPGSWPEDDSEWLDDKDEFEAALREKSDSSKSVKKR
ncbi:hypothetical protein DL95DRAFT_508759 [Leptodontidium sp. 2 PMI_412]|nr:hypothetical protein DL95DRAFT_508759 [Leptodontidium sp. 2 PMI_412]